MLVAERSAAASERGAACLAQDANVHRARTTALSEQRPMFERQPCERSVKTDGNSSPRAKMAKGRTKDSRQARDREQEERD